MNKARLEAFSDGVFAIVITLLILEIRIPEVPESDLAHVLVELAPKLLAYIMSFALIGLYWVFHHNALLLVRKVDGILLWLNLVELLGVSFLPFPTSLLGRYPWAAMPAMLYGANLMFANLTGFLMLLHLRRAPDLAVPEFGARHFRVQWPVYAVVNSGYLLAVLLAPLHAGVSYFIYAAMAVVLVARSTRVPVVAHAHAAG